MAAWGSPSSCAASVKLERRAAASKAFSQISGGSVSGFAISTFWSKAKIALFDFWQNWSQDSIRLILQDPYMPIEKARIIDDGKAVDLTWTSGEKARFHALWLRDNALDGATRSASNGQRLITVLDIPAATRLSEAQVSTKGDLTLTFMPEGKSMTFPAGWLVSHIYDRKSAPNAGWVAPEIKTW